LVTVRLWLYISLQFTFPILEDHIFLCTLCKYRVCFRQNFCSIFIEYNS
jgi:hypothetical protein